MEGYIKHAHDASVEAVVGGEVRPSQICGPLQANATSDPIAARLGRLTKAASHALLALVFLILLSSLVDLKTALTPLARSLPHHATAVAVSVCEVFQAYPPVLTVTPNGTLEITDGSPNASTDIIDSSRPICQQVLVVHSFANSYGQPFVGDYTPPACAFNRITWNLTVTAAGRQYDRLGIVYLGDIEVLRTSTAEPMTDGIQWTYLKDMTNFLPLFTQKQKIIFDLPNIVNTVYTASFNVKITAAYMTATDSIVPPDMIIPVSARHSSQSMPSAFTVPPNVASNTLTLPQNIRRAVFTIAATGQSEEEFWWSNVLQSDIHTFPQSGTMYGYSPFREVQLFIDEHLAGVAWPFPIIFTGGVVPGLWRPIVGIDTFDLKEDEVDITPWLPLLCNGQAHNLTIRVSGLNDSGHGTATLSGTTNSYWWVTGKVFIWLDDAGHVTTGDGPYTVAPEPTFTVSSLVGNSVNGTNITLAYQVNAQRSLSIQSTINLSNGSESVAWQQSLSFSNTGNLTDQGNTEVNMQQTTGYDLSSSGYARRISYPLFACSVYTMPEGNISYVATIDRGKCVQTIGQPVFPTGLESFAAAADVHTVYPLFQGSPLATTQNGTATFLANATSLTSSSFGTTTQDMVFSGIRVDGSTSPEKLFSKGATDELFERHVSAMNNTVTYDEETLANRHIGHSRGLSSGGGGLPMPRPPGRRGRSHSAQDLWRL
ncbi:hypothetical protein BAUCODRAFT_68515 [Baudoinia panamericana UAMH 10762]|uniref:Peptide N-acetyl-beta-D-glucosaminyl asparaginase amidase A N-terminal domain-containing protein n=1 Tax=Baudoinia panamericana (strain UAMH 10762) TaxID=717646 RepID=M2NDX5_BAUPA|nr:uncharacterized protein BAUCODRAFT_68515 [Baudoinia panamericana UAMH 10762]EMC97115.1 hypothetical protein BAUCODRAFT_68515 [Baudoinia panamericana UAMH 10762]